MRVSKLVFGMIWCNNVLQKWLERTGFTRCNLIMLKDTFIHGVRNWIAETNAYSKWKHLEKHVLISAVEPSVSHCGAEWNISSASDNIEQSGENWGTGWRNLEGPETSRGKKQQESKQLFPKCFQQSPWVWAALAAVINSKACGKTKPGPVVWMSAPRG